MAAPSGAGSLRFRVRFEKQAEVDDPAGGTLSDWQPQFIRWADIRPLQGGEGVQAQRLTGTQPVLIIVRRDSQTVLIDSSWRAVEMNGTVDVETYALKTAEDMERAKKFITCMAVAGAADA